MANFFVDIIAVLVGAKKATDNSVAFANYILTLFT